MSRPIEYYTGLATSQYQTAPNFMAWLGAVLRPLGDASTIADALPDRFDIDNVAADDFLLSQGGSLFTAQGGELYVGERVRGAQLDILGQIVGQGRTVNFQPSSGASPVLDDTTYRLVLKARIANNHWDGKIASLQPLWKDLFPGGKIIVQDNQDMSMDVILAGTFDSIAVELITNGYIVPRPEGVLMNISFGDQPYFGFDMQNEYIAGFDAGHWT